MPCFSFVNLLLDKMFYITLLGHSKCGVCFANAVKWIKHEHINTVTISAPFQGTPMADKEATHATSLKIGVEIAKMLFISKKE